MPSHDFKRKDEDSLPIRRCHKIYYYILYYLPALLPFSAYVIYPLVLRTNVLMILDYKNPLNRKKLKVASSQKVFYLTKK